jgi:hypothetical protein
MPLSFYPNEAPRRPEAIRSERSMSGPVDPEMGLPELERQK